MIGMGNMENDSYKNHTESSLEQKRTNEQDTDFKPEVVVASLIEQGKDGGLDVRIGFYKPPVQDKK
jgi:hypothetical protein